MKRVELNVYRIYLIKTARWLMLTTPYVPLFMAENGIDKSGYSQLAAIQALAIIVMEIPSGYLGDLIGRKKTLVLGSLLGVIGYGLYALSTSYLGFLPAMVALGVGQSLISGSDSALLYETLLALKRQGQYARYEGRVIALGSLMETIGAPLGGMLALISLRTPFVAQAVVALIALPAALTLVEPQQPGPGFARSLNLLPALRQSLLADRRLLLLVVYSALIGAATYTMAKAVPYWYSEVVQASAVELGLFWSLLNLSAALLSGQAYRVEPLVRRSVFMPAIAAVVVAGFVGLASLPMYPAMAVLLLFYCGRGLATPILKNYINEQTPSPVRATVLSVRMFLVYLLFAALFPLMGQVGDSLGWSHALLVAASVFALLCGVALAGFALLAKTAETSGVNDPTRCDKH
ncbi:MAG: MFS transporter [Desulfuromonadaceae bacterium]|nr:MFS transporter [Desulfuromonadaceae bacterium]